MVRKLWQVAIRIWKRSGRLATSSLTNATENSARDAGRKYDIIQRDVTKG